MSANTEVKILKIKTRTLATKSQNSMPMKIDDENINVISSWVLHLFVTPEI